MMSLFIRHLHLPRSDCLAAHQIGVHDPAVAFAELPFGPGDLVDDVTQRAGAQLLVRVRPGLIQHLSDDLLVRTAVPAEQAVVGGPSIGNDLGHGQGRGWLALSENSGGPARGVAPQQPPDVNAVHHSDIRSQGTVDGAQQRRLTAAVRPD